MGGGTQTSGSGKSSTIIPSWLKPLLQNTAAEFLQAQKSVPTLSQLYNSVPKLNVPNLSDATMGLIGNLVGAGQNAARYLGTGQADSSSLLPKAAHGNQWQVGGKGGTDSQLVQFLASPDETVTVTTPEQEALKQLGIPGFAQGGTPFGGPHVDPKSIRQNRPGDFGNTQAENGVIEHTEMAPQGLATHPTGWTPPQKGATQPHIPAFATSPPVEATQSLNPFARNYAPEAPNLVHGHHTLPSGIANPAGHPESPLNVLTAPSEAPHLGVSGSLPQTTGLPQAVAERLKRRGVPGFKKGGKAKGATPGQFGATIDENSIQNQIAQSLAQAGITPGNPYNPIGNTAFTAPTQAPAVQQPQYAPYANPIKAANAPSQPASPQGGSPNGNPAGSPYPGASQITQPTETSVQDTPGYKAAQDAINAGLTTLQGDKGTYDTALNTLNTSLGTLNESKTGLDKFLASANNGPSAATKAEESYLNSFLNPTLESQAALMGQANGPALTESLGLADQAALVPLLTADEQNQLNALNQLTGIGQSQAGVGTEQAGIGNDIAGLGTAQVGAGNVLGNLGTAAGQLNLATQEAQQGNALNQANFAQNQIQQALQASGLSYDVAAQQAQALYQQLSNQFNLGQGIQQGPGNLFGNLFGQNTTQQSTTTPPKF